MTTLIFIPFFIQTFHKGIAFSGKGDGFTQLIPFQKYLYHQYTDFKSFYDIGFGLGGDYTKGLSYYYATSPLLIIYFFIIKLGEILFQLPTDSIKFWAANQVIIAYIRAVCTFITSYYLFKYLNPKRQFVILATLMYTISVVTIYYNFTFSFFGDVVILLPLSLYAMERFFRERKIGLFIIAIAITLFSNFYFGYYEFIILGIYFVYRILFPYEKDIVSRAQKIYLLIIAAVLSLMIGSIGFYNGVSAVMENDRQINPNLKLSFLIDFQEKYHIFSNGFYITISIVTFVALLAFNLYKHYFYRLFAVLTWILLIGSLTPYFDSFFNGFSLPARRWVYILNLTSSVLIALFIQRLAEISMRRYLITAIPCAAIMGIMYLAYDGHMSWMGATLVIMIFIGILLWHKEWLNHRYTIAIFIALIFIQQALMIKNYHDTHMYIYERPIASMDKDNYHSAALQKKFNHIQHQDQHDPFNRIEYLSFSALNSPLIYGYRGISLYSSLFNGDILKYYDHTMQIAQPIDKNSTYRLLGNRANLMALWDVKDRFKNPPDDNIPYGFEKKDLVRGTHNEYQHSEDTIHYPSAHITQKVYDNKSLKTPIEREHAMLKGVVLNDITTTNKDVEHNINYKDDVEAEADDAHWNKAKHTLKVNGKNGGIDFKVPHKIADKYKDLYFEFDLELQAPNKPHHVALNEYKQNRNSLEYSYRRPVSPITMRMKSNDNVHLNLSKGMYSYKLKGIYGEDYQALRTAAKNVDKVKVQETRHGYRITKHKDDHGYLVLPVPYVDGMQATVDGHKTAVQKGNGIQTVIPVKKGQEHIELWYAKPHMLLLSVVTIVGIIGAFIFTRYLRKRKN
ncbi:YfhO family protein [Staphylococcus piscifermentans]|nr:YfhO family protein [Staphylococcus piscifermentans]